MQVNKVSELTQAHIWSEDTGTKIWQAQKFKGEPCFYPVYQYKDYFSYSIFELIKLKGTFVANPEAEKVLNDPKFDVIPSNITIDKEISRVGKAHNCSFNIKNEEEYINSLAQALIKDIQEIEQRNKGKMNAILCGGKDSLNLLLLPWQHKTLALSAKPNYELVKQFIEDNGLDIECIELVDKDPSLSLDSEILENCCRADLAHWRWTTHLAEIAKVHDNNVVFWKGQLGDLYMDETWKRYIFPKNKPKQFIRKVYKRLSPYLPKSLNTYIGHRMQPGVIAASWNKSATMQGSHLGFLRSLTGCLFLSAYHGKHVLEVISNADLSAVAQRDIRGEIGKALLGKEVIYPQANPGPEPSHYRENVSDLSKFLEVYNQHASRN